MAKIKELFRRNKTTLIVSLPALLEQIIATIISNLGQLMIAYDQVMVNAIVQANTFYNIIIVAVNILAVGSIVMIARMRGAKDEGAEKIYALSFYTNVIFGLIISFVLIFCSDFAFHLMKVDPTVIPSANEYILYIACFVLFQAMSSSLATFLRAYKKNRILTWVSASTALLNLGLGALFLFVFKMGIVGMALALSISRVVAFILYAYYYWKEIHISLSIKMMFPFPFKLYGKMFSIGLFCVIENLSYNFANLIILVAINGYGISAGNIAGFVNTLVVVAYIFASGLIQESQVEEGEFIGEKEYDKADLLVKDVIKMSLLIGMSFSLGLVGIGYPLFLFLMRTAENPSAAALLAVEILSIDVLLEVGRIINVILVRSLQVAGEGLIVMIIGIFSCWLFIVGGTYLFGNYLGLGLIGCWIGLTIDSLFRAGSLVFLWRKGKWRESKLS
ncbi:MAG: MATE family efflux transporter [Bacilli bacterium]|jgi:Na+-driven multidrug efflux pump|nr:MATE family efflux transporter [Bacilli bacterium]